MKSAKFFKGLRSSLLTLAILLVVLSGAFAKSSHAVIMTQQTQAAKGEDGANRRQLLIQTLANAFKLSDMKKYDDALALAYSALKISREMQEDILEGITLGLLGDIHIRIGDNYIGAKFSTEYLLHGLKTMDKLGVKPYLIENGLLAVDFTSVYEQYIFSEFTAKGTGQDLSAMSMIRANQAIIQKIEAELKGDYSEAQQNTLSTFKKMFEGTYENFVRAAKDKDIRKYRDALVKFFAVMEKFADATNAIGGEAEADEDSDDIESTRRIIRLYSTFLKGLFDKDKKAVRAALGGIADEMKSLMSKEVDDEEGRPKSFEEATKEMTASLIIDLRRTMDNEGEEQLVQMLRANSPRNALNSYLFHFMRADKSLEPVLKRYGYVTTSDFEPFRESILELAESIKKREEEDEEEDARIDPDVQVLPANFSQSDRLLVITSALTPEGRWLNNGSAVHLLAAKEEVSGLIGDVQDLEKRTRINSTYARTHLLMRQAVILYDEGNIPESRSLLQQALNSFQKRVDYDFVWQIHLMLGLQYKKEGDLPQAINSFKEAINIIEGVRSSFRTENIRSLVFEDKVFAYELLIDLLVKANRNAEALSYVERTKARVLLDRLLDRRMKIVPGASATVGKIQSALEKGDELRETKFRTEAGMDSQELESLNGKIRTEEEKFKAALEELRYSSPEFAALVSGETLSANDTQKLLDDDTVILEYFLGGEKTYIFVVNRQGPIEVAIADISYQSLEEKIKVFRERMSPEAAAHQASARELYQLLIGPVENRVQGKRLCLIPHGVSHFLPFQALMKADRYLIENHQLFYSPSSSVLKYAFNRKPTGRSRIFIIASPEGNLKFAEEARDIAGLFQESKLFLSKENAKQAIMEALPQMDILHFATHGNLDQSNPLLSNLSLGGGANLTVADLYGLELKANLVVLSACDTHLGKLTNGDEIIGLTRAFLFAGATSIVTSLWRVEGDSTAHLMSVFYNKLIKQGLSKAEALRQAQIEMIKSSGSNSHPGRWAPFILVGEFR